MNSNFSDEKPPPWRSRIVVSLALAILLGGVRMAYAQVERLPAIDASAPPTAFAPREAADTIAPVGYDAYGGSTAVDNGGYASPNALLGEPYEATRVATAPAEYQSQGVSYNDQPPTNYDFDNPTELYESYQPNQGYDSFSAPTYARPQFEPWSLQVLPSSLIYKSYLAGAKESRFAAHILDVEDELPGTQDTMWDATLGTRVGLLRYGTKGDYFPQGFQIDAEGSAQVRLDIFEDVDVTAVDFRAGVPLTYGIGDTQFKFAYYHLSSHLGDEFQLKNPAFERLNFARDVLVFGYSVYPMDDLRFYAEAGWAFYSLANDPWEFQFGIDYAPHEPTGLWGAPFAAVNTHLRQEHNYSGNVTVQAGWAWRGDEDGHLLRMGVHYFYGKSNHFSFAYLDEEQLGFGVWYDF